MVEDLAVKFEGPKHPQRIESAHPFTVHSLHDLSVQTVYVVNKKVYVGFIQLKICRMNFVSLGVVFSS